MSRPISLVIRDLETQINIAISDSQLPPCIVKVILNSFYQQALRATQTEIAQAEQEYTEEGKQNAESN